MKDFWEEPVKKKLNKKKLVITIFIVIILIAIATVTIIYLNNKEAMEWIDKNILKKEIVQNNLPIIELKEENNADIFAFNKYIGVLSKNNFDIYDGIGKKAKSLTLEISKPIYKFNSRYLVVAEEKGHKLYLIADKDIVWEKDVEGNIAQVSVNKNGYVAVTIVGTSYKTVIAMYNTQGDPLFKTILSSTRVVATSVSDDNKYLALTEIDTSGTMIQSSVKLVSIEEGKNDPENSIKNVYKADSNELITNIKFQGKDKLLCMYTNKIAEIKIGDTSQNIETIQEFGDRKVSFASIELSDSAIIVEEKSSGIFTADSVIDIINSNNRSSNSYTVNSVVKEMYTNNNIIALNLGSEVEFINTSGLLVKRYLAEQEVTGVVLANSVAGIIYRDKIEIINL